MAATPAQIKYQLDHANENRSGEVNAAIITVTVLASVSVILRFMARYVKKAPIKADDYLIVTALLMVYGLFACQIMETHYALGKHTATLSHEAMDNFAKLLYASVLLYWISLFVTKCALLFFYRRVFLFNSKSFRNSLYAIAVFNAACFVAVFFVFTFQCTPVSFAWNKKIKGGKCIDFNTLCVSTAVIAIMTDVAILTLPMPMIWNLKIDKWRKLAISGVFLLGGFVVVSSIIRIPQLTKLDFSDPSYTDVGAATWSTVEASIAIVSANLPTFAPLFRGPGSIASWAASRMSSAGQSRGHGSSKQSGNSSHVSANRQNSEYTDGSGSNFQEEKESAVVPSVVTDIRSEEAKQMAASGIEVKKDVEWN